MPHPADLDTLRAFADGLDEVLVVEEKRRIIEVQVKDALYALPHGRRPRVIGRRDENGEPLLSEIGELSPDAVTRRALARCIGRFHESGQIARRLAFLDAREAEKRSRAALHIVRRPWFCSGCPHNRSTRVPQGSRAHGGGRLPLHGDLHGSRQPHPYPDGRGRRDLDRAGALRGHAARVPEPRRRHLLPLRPARDPRLHRRNVNITYKILYNDAVAMTGGQPVDGPLDPARISGRCARRACAASWW